MNEQQILDVLIDAGVCNGNISPTILPESTPKPYGRYSTIDVPVKPDLISANIVQIRFTLSIWDHDYNVLYALKNTIRNLLNTSGEEIVSTISEDPETKYQRLETSWYFHQTN